jgi:glycosyltransferase involved in cell wall biosynthesis
MSHPSTSVQSPFPFARAKVPTRQAIALISEHADPAAAAGKDDAGGQNVYVRQVGEALAKLGWQVDMFTRKARRDDPAIVQHSPHCRTIRLVAGPEEFIPRDQLFQYMPEFVAAFQKFQSKEGSNYPLIHTNHWMSGWVGLQLKQHSNIQLIHTYHSLGALKYQSSGDRPAIAETRLAVELELLEKADRIVATSPQEEEQLRSLLSQQGAIEVIPCGTDTENFHSIPKADARAKLGFSSAEQIVLYVGWFEPHKGIETLVRAFAALKEESEKVKDEQCTIHPSFLRLVLVGGSDPDLPEAQERQRIDQLVKELGVAEQTRFAGLVGHDILPLYYTAADVCVIPSYYEPFGLVAIEAMACGTPVVASDVGGLRFTVVPEETGLLVPPQNVDAFSGAIARVLSDEIWAMKLRKQAYSRVQENFSWTGVAVKLSDLYRRLLAQSLMQDSILTVPTTTEAIALTTTQPAATLTA